MAFLDETTFQLQIEELVTAKRISYIDAIIHFCECNSLDPEDIAKLVSSNLKGKIKLAAIEDGLMKSESQLPL